MATQPIDFSDLGGKPVSQGPIDFSDLGGKSVTPPPAAQPSFWDNPRAYLQSRSADLQREAQNQMNQAIGPESEKRSGLARLGHSLLSLAPETAAVVDKLVAGGMDWKNAAVMAAGAVDPAVPAAYFGTQGAAQLTGTQPGVEPGNVSPENVQNALLAGSMVAGGAGAAEAPAAGRLATEVAPAGIRETARVTNAALAKAPGAVGGGLGAVVGGAAGHATGIPEAGLAGIIAGREFGRAIGNKVLPQLRVPGEEFGLPKQAPVDFSDLGGKTVEEPETEAQPTAPSRPMTKKLARQSAPLGPPPSAALGELPAPEQAPEAPAKPIQEAAAAPQKPNYVYRVRTQGEEGVPDTGHFQATDSLEQAQSYVAPREAFIGKPQEVVRVDLNKLGEDQYETKPFAQAGVNWTKFKGGIPESAVETVKGEPEEGQAEASLAKAREEPTPANVRKALVDVKEQVQKPGDLKTPDQYRQFYQATVPGLIPPEEWNQFARPAGPIERPQGTGRMADLLDDMAVQDMARSDYQAQGQSGLLAEARDLADANSMDIPRWLRKAESDFRTKYGLRNAPYKRKGAGQ
jgi:hypothetical protein